MPRGAQETGKSVGPLLGTEEKKVQMLEWLEGCSNGYGEGMEKGGWAFMSSVGAILSRACCAFAPRMLAKFFWGF